MPARRPSPGRRGRRLALVLALVGAVLWAEHAAADDKLRQSDAVWKAMDNCTRAASKAYPDYTAEALAKRETQRRLCLRRSNLPGGDDPPVPPPPGSADISR